MDSTYKALEAHAGIDHFLCQRLEAAICLAVVLHEDDIPDLDDLRMIFVDQLASRYFRTFFCRTAVHVYLRARAAGTCIAHLPEVIMLVAVQNMIGGQMLCPDRSRLVVPRKTFLRRTFKDGCIEVSGVYLEYIHDILPSEVDRFFLEIVAERPVSEHLEHGVVVGIMAYFLEVVMLAADAQTFLAVRHTRVLDRVVA